jgi:hypothetical protein
MQHHVLQPERQYRAGSCEPTPSRVRMYFMKRRSSVECSVKTAPFKNNLGINIWTAYALPDFVLKNAIPSSSDHLGIEAIDEVSLNLVIRSATSLSVHRMRRQAHCRMCDVSRSGSNTYQCIDLLRSTAQRAHNAFGARSAEQPARSPGGPNYRGMTPLVRCRTTWS